MRRYILGHWRGELGVARTVFLDWLLVYVLFTLFAGLVETLSAGSPMFTSTGFLFWVLVAAMLVWLVWALVGVARCGIRLLRDPNTSVWRRIAAIVAIFVALAFSVGVSGDLYHLFRPT